MHSLALACAILCGASSASAFSAVNRVSIPVRGQSAINDGMSATGEQCELRPVPLPKYVGVGRLPIDIHSRATCREFLALIEIERSAPRMRNLASTARTYDRSGLGEIVRGHRQRVMQREALNPYMIPSLGIDRGGLSKVLQLKMGDRLKIVVNLEPTFRYENIGPKSFLMVRASEFIGFPRMFGGIPRIDRSAGSGGQGEKAPKCLKPPCPELLAGDISLRLRGIGGPSLLYKIVCTQAIFFGFLATGIGLARALPPIPNGREGFWLAILAAGVILASSGVFFAVKG